MQALMDRLEAKLDKLDEKLDRVVVTQAKHEVTLEGQAKVLVEHMRRTELAENRLIPIEKHVTVIHGGLRAVGAAATIASAIMGLLKLLQLVKGI